MPDNKPQHQRNPLPSLADSSQPVVSAPTGTEPPASGSAEAGGAFTSAYFQSQIAEFWRLMGTREFWRKGQLELAIKAIGLLYLRIDKPTEADRNMLDAALIEATRRGMWIATRPPAWMVEVG